MHNQIGAELGLIAGEVGLMILSTPEAYEIAPAIVCRHPPTCHELSNTGSLRGVHRGPWSNGALMHYEAGMHQNSRHRDILALAKNVGRVTVDQLASSLGLTPQTIRKDLNQLCAEGYLSRVHGGAVLATAVDNNVRYVERRQLARGAKQAIGQAVAERIPERASLFINVGTTTEEVARALASRAGLLIITNNLNVVDILAESHNEIILVGGRLRAADRAMVGPFAAEFIRNFKVDYAIIGASAIDTDGTLLDFDADEVEVARAIIANARNIILASDASKLARSAPVRIASIADIHQFVTDMIHDDDFRDLCERAGVNLVEATRD